MSKKNEWLELFGKAVTWAMWAFLLLSLLSLLGRGLGLG